MVARRTERRRTAPDRRGRALLAAGLALCCAAVGATPPARVVEDLRPLLLEALHAADGAARGILAGPLAEALRHHGVSAEPLEVEVTTLTIYRQPGCRRLNVRFAQRAVKTGDGPPRDRALAFQLNYCRDGAPPPHLE